MDELHQAQELLTRRKFLNRACIGLAGAAGLVVAVPIISYLLSPLTHPVQNVWRDLGAVDSYKEGETVKRDIQEPSPLAWAGTTAKTAVWVRRTSGDNFIIFAVNCTHLGCPVRWLAKADLFLCPCHGGVYYANGDVAGGPPPRPLYRYQVRVQNGHVQALTRSLPVS